jgi:integrase
MTETAVIKPKKPKAKRGNGQGEPWQMANGRWRWEVVLGYEKIGETGKRKRKTKSDTHRLKSEAVAALNQARNDLARGLLTIAPSITVAEYAERWLERLGGILEDSKHVYRSELGYSLVYIGHMKLKDVRVIHVKDCMVKLASHKAKNYSNKTTERTISSRSQQKSLVHLRSMFREAVSDGFLALDPTVGVKIIKPMREAPDEDPITEVLSQDEAARFHSVGTAMWDVGVARLWPALQVALSLGLRRSEVMGLRWQDIDLEQSLLHVRQGRAVGKGGYVRVTAGKTKNALRSLPLSPTLKALFTLQRERQNAERVLTSKDWHETDAVFATDTGKWTHPSNLGRALTNVLEWSEPMNWDVRKKTIQKWADPPRLVVLEAAVLDGKALPIITPHDLRHTFATLALRARVLPEKVAKLLGHSTPTFTLTFYRHVLPDELVEDVFDPLEQTAKSAPKPRPSAN